MQQLEQIIQKLAADPLEAATVTNNDTGELICTEKLGSSMITEYKTVAGFFNSLYDRNIRRIIIQPKRKNGSGFRNSGQPIFIDMDAKTETPAAAPGIAAPVPQQPVHPAIPMMGLGAADLGLNGLFGLMGGMQGDIIHHYKEYPAVVRERDDLKKKVEDQKEKIADLKEELLKKDFSDAKANGTKDMLNGAMETLAPVFMAMLAGRNGGVMPAAAGELNGGNISPVKQHALELLMELGDDETNYMNATIEGFSNNEGFGLALIQLLKTHNLIPQ